MGFLCQKCISVSLSMKNLHISYANTKKIKKAATKHHLNISRCLAITIRALSYFINDTALSFIVCGPSSQMSGGSHHFCHSPWRRSLPWLLSSLGSHFVSKKTWDPWYSWPLRHICERGIKTGPRSKAPGSSERTDWLEKCHLHAKHHCELWVELHACSKEDTDCDYAFLEMGVGANPSSFALWWKC